jgi:drug/metabolite transporter (DMT)-like permease
MPPEHRGELAALMTALCWTISTICFSSAGRRVGSLSVNFIRLVLALLFLCVQGLVWRGLPFPSDASGNAWLWLSLSGFVGFFLGDLCLFRALVVIGPRLSALIQALVPPMTAILAIPVLGERLWIMNWVGMLVTLLGVVWVVLERPAGENGKAQKHPISGYVLGLLAGLGQAIGVILSKLGMGKENYDPFASTQIRVLAGLAGFIVLLGFLRWYPRVLGVLREPRPLALTILGSVAGPFLGVALLLWSFQLGLSTGVASTITSIIPVLIIPFLIIFYRERVSLRAILGAGLAVGGVALLFVEPGAP